MNSWYKKLVKHSIETTLVKLIKNLGYKNVYEEHILDLEKREKEKKEKTKKNHFQFIVITNQR